MAYISKRIEVQVLPTVGGGITVMVQVRQGQNVNAGADGYPGGQDYGIELTQEEAMGLQNEIVVALGNRITPARERTHIGQFCSRPHPYTEACGLGCQNNREREVVA